MEVSLGGLLALVAEDEEVSIADVCDGEEIYTGTALNVPAGLKKWVVGCVGGNNGLGLSLYAAHPFMEKLA